MSGNNKNKMSSNNVQVYFNKTEMNILNEQVYEKINAELKNMHTLSEVNKCKLSNCEKCINFFNYIYPSSMIKIPNKNN